MLTYKNIRNGQEVLLTAGEFTKTLLPESYFKESFLSSPLIEKWESEAITGSSTKLYKIKYKSLKKYVYIIWGNVRNSGIQNDNKKRLQINRHCRYAPGVPYFAVGTYNAGDKILFLSKILDVEIFIKNASQPCRTSYSSLWFDYECLVTSYEKGRYEWFDPVRKDRLSFACNEQNIKTIHEFFIKKVEEFDY